MTDIELLEAAAKAAGVDPRRLPHAWPDRFDDDQWDPLIDNGDAFTLAVKLGFTINPYQEGVFVSRYEGEEVVGEPFAVMGQPDTEATRRAIVRAAAAMSAIPKTGGAST